jgi:hypothetical protein
MWRDRMQASTKTYSPDASSSLLCTERRAKKKRGFRRGGVVLLPRIRRITCLSAAVACCAASISAAETLSWLPVSRDPPINVRPKVRSRASEQNLVTLAEAGFGGVEVGVNFHADSKDAQATLDSLLAAASRLGVQIDLAPGGGQPYVSPGIIEADSMQQLSSEALALEGNRDYVATVRQPATLAGHATLVAVTVARVVDAATRPVLLDLA